MKSVRSELKSARHFKFRGAVARASPLGVPSWEEKRPFHLRKRTSPFIYRGEMHFGGQKMGKLQGRGKIGGSPIFAGTAAHSRPPRGISETPMVRVPANASLLRAFQPRSIDSIHSVYSGLRPIYATQSHPQILLSTYAKSLSGAKLRSVSGSPNARSFYYLETCCSTKFFDEPKIRPLLPFLGL